MKLEIKVLPFQLELAQPFTTSRYTVTTQNTVVVSISNGEYTGYGEATANPYYESTVEKIQASVALVKNRVERSFGLEPSLLWEQIEPFLKHDYFTLCAVDCAYWDFYARCHNKTIRSFWSVDDAENPLTNFTLGIDSISVMKQKILDKPWPIYKIKLGTKDDVEIIESLREITNAKFRVDANCAWSVQETTGNALKMKNLGVEFIEQPLKATDWDKMKILKQESILPIIADESCQRLEDVYKCVDTFHGINIKLMKCGGFTPALKMIKIAREHKLKIMVGCMTESSIGISSLVQLAPLLDYIDADGAMLLKSDIANGVAFKNGKILFSSENGSGANLL
ncbi:dipeptide epimerase [Psychroserpens sp. AS72]|uniref:dipeptide epimerase n=1 Tax=Psychroserpens sp. AS72 TaxID=3135775 RepID=UPI0031753EB6